MFYRKPVVVLNSALEALESFARIPTQLRGHGVHLSPRI